MKTDYNNRHPPSLLSYLLPPCPCESVQPSHLTPCGTVWGTVRGVHHAASACSHERADERGWRRWWLKTLKFLACVQTAPIKHMSDGQKSRLVFAYIAECTPHILFLDEVHAPPRRASHCLHTHCAAAPPASLTRPTVARAGDHYRPPHQSPATLGECGL